VGWREVAGTGTIYTHTVVTHPTHEALAGTVPYVVAIVELDEGPRVVTGITGCDPHEVRTGMRVRVTFTAVAADVTLPYFEVAPAGGRPPKTPRLRERPPDTPFPGEPGRGARRAPGLQG
jgi:hypothetical protein